MGPITPHLWYDTEAIEAAEFYVSLFPDSAITHTSTIRNTPSGDCDLVSFEIAGQPFWAISAGPLFAFNPSISFIVNFDPSRDADARENLEDCWEALAQEGNALMPLGEYPFSELYGWVADRYGLTWQLILSDPEGEPRPFIVPSLMFANTAFGEAEEASDFYRSVFRDSRQGLIARQPEDAGPELAGTVMFMDFMIEDTWMAAMDSPGAHDFEFNEAVSLVIPCKDQDEIDYYWEHLSAVPEAEQCGWLKDKYGVSWQVWPTVMREMMADGSPEQIDRVSQALLTMKKYDIAAISAAYDGE